MKHMILFLLLSATACAQTWDETNVPVSPTKCKVINFAGVSAGSNLTCFALRSGTAIERIYIVVDSALVNVTNFGVYANETALILCNAGSEIYGRDPNEYEAPLQQGKVYYDTSDYTLHFNYSGGIGKGRLKIYIVTRELFK